MAPNKIKEKIMSVAEKVIDCGGRPSETPARDNVYPKTAFIVMKKGKWQEVHWNPVSMYGCSNENHHTVYWNLEDASPRMSEGDWLIEYHPVARYRCKTRQTDECP